MNDDRFINSPARQRKIIVLAIALCLVIAIILIISWMSSPKNRIETPVVTTQIDPVLSRLNQAPSNPSQKQIDSVSSALSKTKNPTQAQKEAVSNFLLNSK